MAKRRARKGEFLLCRGGTKTSGAYLLFRPTGKPQIDKVSGWWDGADGPIWDWCAREWEELTPKSLHLKRGGGPIRIRVERVAK